MLEQVHTYKVGELLSYMTSEREAILGDFEKMVADGQKITTMTKQEIKKTIFEKLQDELGRDVKIELSPKGHLGAVYITLNDKTSEFKAGDSMTNLLITIIRRTRNFEIYMPADDLYLDMFGHDDYYLTEEQRADEKIAHRRHVNMRKLDDTIRNINLKIRRETGTNRNLIIKNRDKYRLNPELQRLKKTRKTKK